jgi:hypothetical protein
MRAFELRLVGSDSLKLEQLNKGVHVTTARKMTKCHICQCRPAKDKGICKQCAARIAADTKSRRPSEPVKFLVYRESVVGLFPIGGGKVRPRMLKRSAEHLPKSKTIDLNHFCPGYTRAMIKSFKATVLKLSAVQSS